MWFNPFVIWLLRSPFHTLVSKSMMLVRYTGRKSGKTYVVPVDYFQQENSLFTISLRKRTWWRNLLGGVTVLLRLQGKEVKAFAIASEEAEAIAAILIQIVSRRPAYAHYLQIGLDPQGKPKLDDALRTANERVVIRYNLEK